METPELIELRKKKIEEAMDGNETPQLFTVLPERRTGPVGAAMMASTHIYDITGVRPDGFQNKLKISCYLVRKCIFCYFLWVFFFSYFLTLCCYQVARKTGGGQESHGVEVALAPEELELDPMAMTQKYEEHVREQQAQVEKEDFSDMVAEHAAKQKVLKLSYYTN
ncbi:Splicing factor 3B subunit 2 [Goodea atripinnis]|uniref:Splicing factor 3B subunit 2 n=1 Tax=Goodea atripinnis TaxID=208336 RepID=A0ABV0MW87_9TELE